MKNNNFRTVSKEETEAILKKALICHLGLSHRNKPYVIPMGFGYKDNNLYFCSTTGGRKIEILRENPQVFFEVSTDVELVLSMHPCGWSMRYSSVMGSGKAEFLKNADEKREALKIITEKYSGGEEKPLEIPGEELDAAFVIRVCIEEMGGRHSPG
jgi:nitroimidazol reductase NimA-like FMN-containing flavoprotein (pyridoxamine 5'-phosphate oxidase superfamily)